MQRLTYKLLSLWPRDRTSVYAIKTSRSHIIYQVCTHVFAHAANPLFSQAPTTTLLHHYTTTPLLLTLHYTTTINKTAAAVACYELMNTNSTINTIPIWSSELLIYTILRICRNEEHKKKEHRKYGYTKGQLPITKRIQDTGKQTTAIH